MPISDLASIIACEIVNLALDKPQVEKYAMVYKIVLTALQATAEARTNEMLHPSEN